MKDATDWMAANDHKGALPGPGPAWTRRRGETWFRPDVAPGTSGAGGETRPPQHLLVTASRVAGARVFSADGQRLGRIAEIAIDEAVGEVAFVVLTSGGFLGFGERQMRVPWTALSYRPGRVGYELAMPAGALDHPSAPYDEAVFQGPADRGGWARA